MWQLHEIQPIQILLTDTDPAECALFNRMIIQMNPAKKDDYVVLIEIRAGTNPQLVKDFFNQIFIQEKAQLVNEGRDTMTIILPNREVKRVTTPLPISFPTQIAPGVLKISINHKVLCGSFGGRLAPRDPTRMQQLLASSLLQAFRTGHMAYPSTDHRAGQSIPQKAQDRYTAYKGKRKSTSNKPNPL